MSGNICGCYVKTVRAVERAVPIVAIGGGPAVAHAVFHATGRRVRELSVTAEASL
ncbi:hypothetical protein [Streptomyces sp. 4F14]|uniref:hypothetical protein n=1 Tax=Streptomyces sp. 4F14 TaxID=3394380 RepID=UPI003A88D83A